MSHSVLVIDDSLTVRKMLTHILEQQSYRVLVASSGEEGLQQVALHRPDLVITDAELPGISGRTLIQRIRQDRALRHIPCLFLTGSEQWTDEEIVLEAGADTFVRKDEAPEVLLARVAALLRRTIPLQQSLSSLFGPKRILAVDDSPTYLQFLTQELSQEGYEIIPVATGEEALQALSVQAVDAILLDVMMPGLSGQETCQQIRQNPQWCSTPLLMLTSMEEQDTMLQAMELGADDYIFKSSNLDVLRARLRAQLRRKQFEDEILHYREQLLRKELEAAEAQAARQIAETRASLLADLEKKNQELAQINQELERAKEIALREAHFKSQFLANMSHELRTPLNAILGFSELMLMEAAGPVSPQQQEFLSNVVESGKHLLALVNDILDLSKIEAGKMVLSRAWTQLSDTLSSIFNIIQPMAIQKGLHFEMLTPDNPCEAYIDPVRFKQILYNLLSNAIKFTPKQGKVWLTVETRGQDLILRTKDTGIGIAAEDLPRLFREFERIEPVQGERQPGTGLGLALTKRLVRLHDGNIIVESKLQQGTTFTVTLPVLRPVSSSTTAAAQPVGFKGFS